MDQGNNNCGSFGGNAMKPVAVKKDSKRKGWKKPKGMPKRPLSAYNLFFAHERQRLIEERKSKAPEDKKIGFGGMARNISSKWNTLTAEEKIPFQQKAAIEQKRYKKELEVWRSKQKKQEAEKEAEEEVEDLLPTLEFDEEEQKDILQQTTSSTSALATQENNLNGIFQLSDFNQADCSSSSSNKKKAFSLANNGCGQGGVGIANTMYNSLLGNFRAGIELQQDQRTQLNSSSVAQSNNNNCITSASDLRRSIESVFEDINDGSLFSSSIPNNNNATYSSSSSWDGNNLLSMQQLQQNNNNKNTSSSSFGPTPILTNTAMLDQNNNNNSSMSKLSNPPICLYSHYASPTLHNLMSQLDKEDCDFLSALPDL